MLSAFWFDFNALHTARPMAQKCSAATKASRARETQQVKAAAANRTETKKAKVRAKHPSEIRFRFEFDLVEFL